MLMFMQQQEEDSEKEEEMGDHEATTINILMPSLAILFSCKWFREKNLTNVFLATTAFKDDLI